MKRPLSLRLASAFAVLLWAETASAFSQHSFLPATDLLEKLVIEERSGSSAVKFSGQCAEDVTIFEEGEVQTYWGGTASEGTVLKFNGTVVPIAADHTWEFNGLLRPEPNPIQFEWEDADGKKGKASYLLVWKKIPPVFHIEDLGGKAGEHKEFWTNDRKDYDPPPFTALYAHGKLAQGVVLGDDEESDLAFRNIVVPAPQKAKVSWELNLYNEEWLASNRTIGEGDVPEFIPFKSLQTTLTAHGKYRYQLSRAINDKVTPGPQRDLPVRQVASRKWYVAVSAGLSSSNWETTDLQNAGTQATLSSRLNPAFGAVVTKRFDDKWEPVASLSVERVKFEIPPGKTSGSASAFLLGLSVGTAYYLMENWRIAAMLGVKQEPLIVATSLADIQAEAVMLPNLKLATMLRAATWDKIAADVELGLTFFLGKSGDLYSVSSASETYGKLTVSNFWEKYDGFAALVLAKKSFTASIESQAFTTLRLELGMRFAP